MNISKQEATMKTEGIIMGVGTPNICRSGDKTMCAIILTEKLGFIRVYPIPGEEKFGVWRQVTVELEETNTDPRHESYKLKSYQLHCLVKDCNDKRNILNDCILNSGNDDPIVYQNKNRNSIALVKIEGNCSPQLIMQQPRHDQGITTQQTSWNKPYLHWESTQGKPHKTHLVGREVYEGLRSFVDEPWKVWSAMNLNRPDYDYWLLLGNIKNQMNVFVGVWVHRLKKNTNHFTPTFYKPINGKGDDWPYCKQEDGNARIAGNQLEMFTTSDI